MRDNKQLCFACEIPIEFKDYYRDSTIPQTIGIYACPKCGREYRH